MESRNYKGWSYSEAKTVLDQIGDRKYVARDVYRDIATGVNRTTGSVASFHTLWNIHIGKWHHKTPVSKRLKLLFDTYKTEHPEKFAAAMQAQESHEEEHNVMQETSGSLDRELQKLEASFEGLKEQMAVVIAIAVEQKAKEEVAAMQHELIDLRKFKESVRTTSVFGKLRETLTGKKTFV